MSSDSIPPIGRLTPVQGVPTAPLLELEERLGQLTIQVDRLKQSANLMRWVATVAAVFALGSVITVARMLYGWGRDDEALRGDVRQLQRSVEELRVDVKELRSSHRYGAPSVGKDGQP